MQKKKAEIIKVSDNKECYICNGKDKSCKACNGTGIFNEYHYHFIVNGMCFSSDHLA